MTRITYHLTSEPAMLAQLRGELAMVMPDPYVTPPLEQLEQLPYLVSLFKNKRKVEKEYLVFPVGLSR